MASTDDLPNPLARLALDANEDGRVTAADLGDFAGALFFLPGDGFIWALSTYLAPVATALDLGAADYGGVLAAFVSTCVWFAAFVTLAITYQSVLDFDRRLTHALRELVTTAKVRWRIARALLLQRWRTWQASRVPANRVEFAADLELSAAQLAALRAHAELAAGYALSVSDTARALGARTRATLDLLDGLHALGLLHRTVGGADGESAYTLTAAGKALLLFQQLSKTAPGETISVAPAASPEKPARPRGADPSSAHARRTRSSA